MRTIATLRAVMTALFLFDSVMTATAMEAVVPAQAQPGGVLAILVSAPGESEGLRLLLSDEQNRRWAAGSTFSVGRTELHSLHVGLLGVPSTAPPGSYRLLISDEAASLTRQVTIAARQFAREEIALNQAMSRLRATPDPRRTEEARYLARLLETFDHEARFHFDALLLPLDSARLTALFGDRRTFLYTDGQSAHSIHSGVDYAAPVGQPVYAAGAGRVAFAGPRIISGYTVVIEHLPGVFTMYFHMDEIGVKDGEMVAGGQAIGTAGATGLVTGSHLHWELRVQGVAVDPKPFLEKPLLDKAALFGIMESIFPEGR